MSCARLFIHSCWCTYIEFDDLHSQKLLATRWCPVRFSSGLCFWNSRLKTYIDMHVVNVMLSDTYRAQVL